jgi:hypothetical protein
MADVTVPCSVRLAVVRWATNQNARNNKTDIIDSLIFMASKPRIESNATILRPSASVGRWVGSENPVEPLGLAGRFRMPIFHSPATMAINLN